MLSRPRKPPSNRLRPSRSLRFSHQVKLASKLLKMRFRNGIASSPSAAAVEAVVEERRPGVNGRIDVVEVPLVGRQLTVRVLVAFEQHERRAARAAKSGSTNANDDGVERQIPGGEPGVLPLVRHRDDVGAEHVEPVLVAGRCCSSRAGTPRSFSQSLDVVDVGLLRPEQPAVALADDVRRVVAQRRRG